MEPNDPSLVAFDPLLRPAEAAEYLYLGSKATLNKWRTKKRPDRPRAVEDGGKVLYRVSDLDAWLMARPGYIGDDDGAAVEAPRHSRRPPQRFTIDTMRTYWFQGALEWDPLLTIDEAEQYLAIPKSSLYSNRCRNPNWGPRPTEIAGRLRYRLSTINRWVEANLEDQPALVLQ